MKFTSSYEPQNFESDIYAAWESEGLFNPSEVNNQTGFSLAKKTSGEASQSDRKPASRPYYSIVMPPPNANGNLHIGHGLTIALEDALTRFYRLQGKSSWYIRGQTTPVLRLGWCTSGRLRPRATRVLNTLVTSSTLRSGTSFRSSEVIWSSRSARSGLAVLGTT